MTELLFGGMLIIGLLGMLVMEWHFIDDDVPEDL